MKQRILIVCTHNSARSQMAEGMFRAWGGERFEVESAGTEVSSVRSEAIGVMSEIGIDISGHRSKHIAEFAGREFEWLITVCDRARQACAMIPGIPEPTHWGIEDPTEAEGSDDERVTAFRRVRDDLRNRIHMFILATGHEDAPARTAVRLPATGLDTQAPTGV